MDQFEYDLRSVDLVYNGQQLDSLLELKFVLMIEGSHAWVRKGLEIYYNINRQQAGIKGGLEKHTPDFLIREWTTGEATLVEIKPDGYDDVAELDRRRKICRKFIKQFAHDWKYITVRERDITLSLPQQEKFENARKFYQISGSGWYGTHHPNNTFFSDAQYECFVRYGMLPAPV